MVATVYLPLLWMVIVSKGKATVLYSVSSAVHIRGSADMVL